MATDLSPWALAADLLDPPAHPHERDPVGFATDVLRFEPWSKQREIMTAVRDHPRVAVRACHGPGKTAVAAQVALWFLRVHPNSRVITTAPTWQQVEQLLWREIRAAIARGKDGVFPAATATKLELGDEWFAIGLSTNQPERFQGHHADHILLIVDEASGVEEAIYEAAEGFLTAEGAKILLLGNPTRIGGEFFRAFTTARDAWYCIDISVFDTPNYTGEKVSAAVARSLPHKGWAEEKKRQWGEGTPMYEVRVLGRFPSSASNAVAALSAVEQAQAASIDVPAEIEPGEAVVACDVARFGDDETVIATRHAEQVRIVRRYQGADTMETVGNIVRVWRALRKKTGQRPVIVVDDDGVGGGVTDRLRELGLEVVAFNGAARPYRPNDYPNRRSELWFTVAEEFLPSVDLDPDEKLAADLTSPTYKLDSRGRRVVEPKAETKKRLGRSPDSADAVLLTFVRPPVVHVPTGQRRKRRDEYDAPAPRGETMTGDLIDEPM